MNDKFSTVINSNTPTLVDFYAEWCGPCKAMKPILEKLKLEIGANARIIKIDIDKNNQIANTFNIQSVPTLMLFKNGKILWKQSGTQSVQNLKEIINKNL